MVHKGPPCTPTLYNLTGYGTNYHDVQASSNYWAVFIGKSAPGIYLDWAEAERQAKGAHNSKWQKFPTYAQAVQYWDVWCLALHNHKPTLYKVKGISGTFATYDEALVAAAQNFITPA
ncbi:hypothetical protein C8R43DRAFT_1123500 [Mycena crocata]|nr:hypothetical protein C8R43DRAFT_1123500 [Mycena crocata]